MPGQRGVAWSDQYRFASPSRRAALQGGTWAQPGCGPRGCPSEAVREVEPLRETYTGSTGPRRGISSECF